MAARRITRMSPSSLGPACIREKRFSELGVYARKSSPYLRIPIDPADNTHDLHLVVLVEETEDAEVVEVGKRRLHKAPLFNYPVFGKEVNDVVDKRHLVGAEVAPVEEVGKGGFGCSGFRDIIGVSIPEDGVVEEIQLKFTAQQAKYIQTKPLHPSQHVLEETREYTIFTFRLMQNYELESLILSFGERVEVLRPEGLREKVKGRVGKLFDEYAAGGAP